MLRGLSKACASAEPVVAEKVMVSIWSAARVLILMPEGYSLGFGSRQQA
jgi:hypothetical protein